MTTPVIGLKTKLINLHDVLNMERIVNYSDMFGRKSIEQNKTDIFQYCYITGSQETQNIAQYSSCFSQNVFLVYKNFPPDHNDHISSVSKLKQWMHTKSIIKQGKVDVLLSFRWIFCHDKNGAGVLNFLIFLIHYQLLYIKLGFHCDLWRTRRWKLNQFPNNRSYRYWVSMLWSWKSLFHLFFRNNRWNHQKNCFFSPKHWCAPSSSWHNREKIISCKVCSMKNKICWIMSFYQI